MRIHSENLDHYWYNWLLPCCCESFLLHWPLQKKGKGKRSVWWETSKKKKKGIVQWRMLLSGTSIAQQSQVCSGQVLTIDWLLADLCPKWTHNAVLICNPDQDCSHTLFSAKPIFSLPSLWKPPEVCENPSVTDDESSCWKRVDWSDKMLGFHPGDRLRNVVLCTRQHQGPANTLDLLTGRIMTPWHGLPWLLKHRNRKGTVGNYSDFNKIWEKCGPFLG